MAYAFNLPDIGEGVNEGEIVKWLVAVGEPVAEDQAIVEIMTDKATVEIASPVAGKVLKHAAPEGDVVAVGALLADIDAAAPTESAPTKEPAIETPAAPSTTPAAAVQDTNVISMPANSTQNDSAVLAAPATRKFARENNVSLSAITPTGSNGRVLKEDVQKYISGGSQPATQAAAPVVQNTPTYTPPQRTTGEQTEERIPLRGIRKVIAKNMLNSKLSAAHFTHVDEMEATELVKVRSALKETAAQKGVKLTYLPFIIKAICEALKEHPKLNSTLDEATQEIVVKKYYNIGIAVVTQTDDLIVPVIHNADQKGLVELAYEIQSLAEKARTGKLSPNDLKGGTFTLTSMGRKGGLLATPIINFPEVAIMGFHKIEDRAVVRNGEIVVRKMANVSVSIDHRIVDGVLGADFLKSFMSNLENPSRMLL